MKKMGIDNHYCIRYNINSIEKRFFAQGAMKTVYYAK